MSMSWSEIADGALAGKSISREHAREVLHAPAGFELELASGETLPVDPEAMMKLAPPTLRPSLPVAQG